jgi:hypothetical protein
VQQEIYIKKEIAIKEEPIDDALTSTPVKQHMLVKREEFIGMKEEPLFSDDETYILQSVSIFLHINVFQVISKKSY